MTVPAAAAPRADSFRKSRRPVWSTSCFFVSIVNPPTMTPTLLTLTSVRQANLPGANRYPDSSISKALLSISINALPIDPTGAKKTAFSLIPNLRKTTHPTARDAFEKRGLFIKAERTAKLTPDQTRHHIAQAGNMIFRVFHPRQP